MTLHKKYRLFSRTIFSLFCLANINPRITQAQVIPDNTLGAESSTVNSINEFRSRIEGGAARGGNLFHSFLEFNIGEGIEVYFGNPGGITNILSRVTGANISEISGTLGVEGNANLFLINPNGIIFGENAQLDIGGSFVATTANQVDFGDGNLFKVSDKKPLLSWNAPIGLGLDGTNGSITVNGKGNQITSNSTFSPIKFSERPQGLSIADGETLALVGNGLNFNGGVVSTQGGDINLISVESGSIEINQTENRLTLSDESITKYQDINLGKQSLVDVSGKVVGNISLIGKTINLLDGSFLLAQNQGNSSCICEKETHGYAVGRNSRTSS